MSRPQYVKLRSRLTSDIVDRDDDDDADKYIPEQFRELPERTPWRAIALAIFLFVVGSILLILGCLFFTGHIPPVKESDDRWLAMIIIGSLMFIPGAFHTFIAVQAYRQVPGYRLSDIPHYDD